MNRGSRAITALLVAAVMTLSALPLAYADLPYSRTRSGTSRWAPQNGTVTARYFNSLNNKLQWSFSWGDVLHYTELNGRHRGFEAKARTDIGYADQYGSAGYSFMFPSGSRPYRDTQATDLGPCCAFGIGAGDANYFLVGPTYSGTVSVRKTFLTTNFHQISWDMLAMTREDHSLPGCLGNETFCNFPDYVAGVVKANTFSVRQVDTLARSWTIDYLINQSFEQGLTGYGILDPSNNRVVYCDGRGFGSNCFLEYNAGGAPQASVFQDYPYGVRSGDKFSSEVMLRCPGGQPGCSATLAIWGRGVTQDESRSIGLSLPADGIWYICRLDQEHGFGTGFSSNHSELRWEVYNTGGNNLDVDFTLLGPFSDRIDGTLGDQAAPPVALPVCYPAGSFDT